jgi:HEPN domain-containing protein
MTLRGFLYSKVFRAMVTHSVFELLQESVASEGSVKEFLDHGKELDILYIGSRYPNVYPSGAPYKYYTREIAERCLTYAESI